MTQRVNPSTGRVGSALATAAAIRYGGASPGWIVPDDERYLTQWDPDLADGPLEAFSLSSSSSSLTVTFASGEGFVGGAWLANDASRTLAPGDPGGLAASTSNQLVYLGWSYNTPNTVKIGREGAFESYEARVPIYSITTNASGVTDTTDLRPIDQQIDVKNARYESALGGDGVVSEAETAHNATNFDGRSATVFARQVRTLNFPVAILEPGDRYRQVERINSGQSLKLLSVTLMTDSGSTHSNMVFRLETTGGSSIYTTTSKNNSGTIASPLTSHSGAADVLLGIHNESSSTDRRVSAQATYIIE